MIIHKARMIVLLLSVLAIFLSVMPPITRASDINVVVLYPNVPEPHISVFREIVSGIESSKGINLTVETWNKRDNYEAIREKVSASNPSQIIVLGNHGKEIAKQLSHDYSVIAGAMNIHGMSNQGELPGISLAPSPARVLSKLKQLSPNTERVIVVYHPQTSGWLIEKTRIETAGQGIQLVAYPAKDALEALEIYKKVLSGERDDKSAIWLLQGDPVLDERGMVPIIISRAWANKLVVFSNNPTHVIRGALFSMYPDSFNMGKSLAGKVIGIALGGSANTDSLQDLLVAINTRTAEHLDLKISRSNSQGFDLVFP